MGAYLAGRFEDLTDRERECLYLATRFMRPKEIAAQLGISPKTVESHLAKVTVKLDAHNPRHATKLYAEFLNESGSGNVPRETSRLSDSLTDQSSLIPEERFEQSRNSDLRGVWDETHTPLDKSVINALLDWRPGGIDAEDLNNRKRLCIIMWGFLVLALALAVMTNLVDALDRMASAAPRP